MPIVKETVTATLKEVEQRVDNPNPVLRLLVPSVRGIYAKLLESEGLYGGGQRWAPLRMATVVRKLRAGQPALTLFASGALWRSLVEGGKNSVTTVDADGLHVGSSNPILNFLRGGTKRMAARNPEPESIEDADLSEWATKVREFVETGKP